MKNQGWFRRIFDSHETHQSIAFLIILNAIGLGLLTSGMLTPLVAHDFFSVQKIILGIFFLEIILRWVVMGRRFVESAWNTSDVLILILSFGFSVGFSILRTFRLVEFLMSRKRFQKIQHILVGIRHSAKGIMSIFFVMIFVFYIYGVLGVMLYGQDAAFAKLSISFKTLFQILTGDDWTVIMKRIEAFSPYAWIYFISFFIIATFTVLNLIIGVVVNALQSAEEEIAEPKEDPVLAELKKLRSELENLKAIPKSSKKKDS